MIKVQDNGTGIDERDLPLAIERYATSKIEKERDLDTLASYGFRGEALAAIAEVSRCMMQTRTAEMPAGMGYELSGRGTAMLIKPIPLPFTHGTIVRVNDLFHDVPARLKFLKSTATERSHLRGLLMDYLILHRDKARTILHQGKVIRDVAPADSLAERVVDLSAHERKEKLMTFEQDLPRGTFSGIL